MDRNEFRRRVLSHWLQSPLIVVPAGLGTAALLLAFALGQPWGFFGFLGASGLLFGAGMAISRWVLAFDRLSQAAFAEMQSESEKNHYAYLDDLQQRLAGDHDPRLAANLAKLRQVYQRLERADLAGDDPAEVMLPEIRAQADELYQSCLKSLERVCQQGEVAQQMATPEGRQEVLRWRDQLLEEVSRSVDNLGATLDHLQVAALKRDTREDSPTAIREELERGLGVARKVEQRMDELEQNVRDFRAADRHTN